MLLPPPPGMPPVVLHLPATASLHLTRLTKPTPDTPVRPCHPPVQIADKIGLPGLYLHEAVEDESVEGTGNLIWTAGVRLSQHLVKNRGGELKGARVLDLGSGTGVCMCVCCCRAKGVVGCRQDPAASRCSTSFSLLQWLHSSLCTARPTALLSCPLLLPLPGLSVVPLLAAWACRHRWHHSSMPGRPRDADRHAGRAAPDLRERAGQC